MSVHTPGIGDNGGPPLELILSEPQHDLVFSPFRYPAMVAGFGSGKTQALIRRILRLKFEYPALSVAYYLPTFALIKLIVIPRMVEALAEYNMFEGVHYKLNKSDMWIEFPGEEGGLGGKIIMRSMDRPESIIGYEVADSAVDELDTLKPEDARDVWQKVMARNRQKKPDGADNTAAVGTTPEGFRFVYENWFKAPPDEQYQLIRASTYSNGKHLPKNYISDLFKQYPSNRIAAYINGDFVNLTSGSVYPSYDRKLNASDEVIGHYKDGETLRGEALHIGLDFNVTKMAGIIHVYRGNNPHAVAELINLYDTPEFIKVVKERYSEHFIFVYPDASGGARKSNNASETDIALLKQAGFSVQANAANPFVRDRVVSMNVMLEQRRYRINAGQCPHFASALEQQVYADNGEPDKTKGKDHPNDAAGYFIAKQFPVKRHQFTTAEVMGA